MSKSHRNFVYEHFDDDENIESPKEMIHSMIVSAVAVAVAAADYDIDHCEYYRFVVDSNRLFLKVSRVFLEQCLEMLHDDQPMISMYYCYCFRNDAAYQQPRNERQ
jgi:hypothetical protein